MIIGVDLGTTSISAILFDPERKITVARAQCAHQADIPELPVGWHEQCPDVIANAACSLIALLLRQSGVPPGQISGVTLTGQQHGIVIVDKNLAPLTKLITWRDQRTNHMSINLCCHSYGSETGCFMHPGYGGLILHHFFRNNKIPRKAFKAMSITGFLAAKLTGRLAIDETMAASWGLLDIRSNQWHRPLLDKLAIPEGLLPDITPSCKPFAPVAFSCGSSLTERSIVYGPVGDNQAGFAGVGECDGRHAVINLGTSSQLSVLSEEYGFDPRLETRPFPGGRFLHVYAALCGGWAYAYVAQFFRDVVAQICEIQLPLEKVFDRMQKFADSCETSGLLADTRFAGERNGKVESGSITGINTSNLTARNLVRATANGIVGELWKATRSLPFQKITQLLVVGNAAGKNPILIRALHEKFDRPCVVVHGGGEAALGSIRLACSYLS